MKQIHNRLSLLLTGTIFLTIFLFAELGMLEFKSLQDYIWGMGIAVGLSVFAWFVTKYLVHWCVYPAFHQIFILSDDEQSFEENSDFQEIPELSHLQKHIQYMASHLRETDRELKEKYLELDEAQAIKSGFVDAMSHEFWMPLNSILGICETLQLQPLNEAQNQLLQIVYISAQDLRQMITNVQKFALLDSGKIQINPNWIELEPFIGDLVNECLGTVDQTSFQLETDWDEKNPEQFFFDRQLLELMLFNLIRTTIKISKGGTLKFKITQEQQKMLRFSMHDPGNSMIQMNVEKIFERFSSDSENTPFTDMGVSLALTRELAELAGGESQSEKDPQGGRSFWFQIPLASSNQMAKGKDEMSLSFAEDLASEDDFLTPWSSATEENSLK
ncbi:MAG: HAMP domain-containing histidine kinase [SAR324 cluster bacterium]|nr:HAMP domain-containing histidine kinase [SAR324 cluster bacterium]